MAVYEQRVEGHIGLGEFTYVTTKMQLPETKAWADEIMGGGRELWGPEQLPTRDPRRAILFTKVRELRMHITAARLWYIRGFYLVRSPSPTLA